MSDQTALSLWTSYKENPEDETLRYSLVEHYIPFVRRRIDIIIESASCCCFPDGAIELKPPKHILKIERAPLISAARVCLVELIDKFDPSLPPHIDFETYAVPFIHYAVIRELRPHIVGLGEDIRASAALKDRILKLSKNERLIFIMYHFEKMKTKEIGSLFDLSEARICCKIRDIHRRLNLDWPPFLFV